MDSIGSAGVWLTCNADTLLGSKYRQSTRSVRHRSAPKKGLYLYEGTAIEHGFGKHMNAIPTTSVFNWFKYLYAFEFLYNLGMASVKYSV